MSNRILGQAPVLAAAMGIFLVAFDWHPSAPLNPGIVDAGEEWLHLVRREEGSDWYMPIAPVVGAWLENHASERTRACAVKLVVSLPMLLVFALGCLLHSFASGIIAAVLCAYLYVYICPRALLDLEQVFIAIALLLAANIMASSFRSASTKKLLVGLALSISLFVKGILALFPFVVMGHDFFSRRGAPPARRLRHSLLLIALPCLSVLFWGFAHYARSGKFILLEGRRADANIITGALGLTGTIEGDAYALAGISRDDSVPLWAAKEILRHPARYASSVMRRCWFAVSMHPVLFFAFLLALLRFRKDGDFLLISALAGYYLLIHCAMSVEGRYFLPFWFLACPLAASLIDCVYRRDAAPQNNVAAKAILWLCFTPALLLFSFTLCLAAVRPFRGPAETYWRALAGSPNDPWLWRNLGRQYMGKGEFAKAADALRRACRLNPSPGAKGEYAVALFAGGDYRHATIGNVKFQDFLEDAGYCGLFIKLLAALEEGDFGEPRALFARAKEEWRFYRSCLREASMPWEIEALARLRAQEKRRLTDEFAELLRPLPPGRTRRLLEGLESSKIALDYAELSARLEGPELSARLEGPVISPRRASPHSMAMKLQEQGKYGEAKAILEQLVARHAANAVYLSDLGVLKCLMGRHAGSISVLKRAISVNPRYLPAYLSLGSVYLRLGEKKKAVEVYEAALASNRASRCASQDILLHSQIERELKHLCGSLSE